MHGLALVFAAGAALFMERADAMAVRLLVIDDPPLNISILDKLNELRDTKINPAIAAAVPASISLNIPNSGSSGSCIVPSPFHGCICHASAGYDVTLTQANGLNTLKVVNFTQVLLSPASQTEFVVSATAVLGLGSASVSGNAHASEDACGIKADEHGTFSADMSTSGIFELNGTATIIVTDNCTNITVTNADIKIDSLSLSNIKLDIDLGPIKINVGDLAKLILDLVPSIKPAIEGAVSKELDNEIPGVVDSVLPCFPGPPVRRK